MSALIRAATRLPAFQPIASSSRTACLSSFPSGLVKVPQPRNWRVPEGHPAPSPLSPAQVDTEDGSPTALEEIMPVVERHAPEGRTPPEYAAHSQAIKESFEKDENGVRWAPPRRLSRQAMEGLRTLHRHDPTMFTTPVLAEKFRLSPEAIRRILRSRWEPSRTERMRLAVRDERWKAEWIEKSKARDRELREREERAREERRAQARGFSGRSAHRQHERPVWNANRGRAQDFSGRNAYAQREPSREGKFGQRHVRG
jgi:hypothetical protein